MTLPTLPSALVLRVGRAHAAVGFVVAAETLPRHTHREERKFAGRF